MADVGRPLKFQDVEEMQHSIDEFFALCDEKEEPYTITGLAIHLGTFRSVLCDYQLKDDFSNTIKMAKQRCENYAEKRLYTSPNPSGPIFALKNYDWSDKQTTELTGPNGGPIATINSEMPPKEAAALYSQLIKGS